MPKSDNQPNHNQSEDDCTDAPAAVMQAPFNVPPIAREFCIIILALQLLEERRLEFVIVCHSNVYYTHTRARMQA